MAPRSISALRERPRDRVEVELDGERWRTVPADVVVRAGLAVGQVLDRATAGVLAHELRKARAVKAATRALAARDRSCASLDERLARAGIPSGARAEALDDLQRVGLVDDARLARATAEALAARGYGDVAIKARLTREGVSAELARAALGALAPERDRVRALFERDGGSPRTLRRLAARGFDRDTLAELAGFADSE